MEFIYLREGECMDFPYFSTNLLIIIFQNPSSLKHYFFQLYFTLTIFSLPHR